MILYDLQVTYQKFIGSEPSLVLLVLLVDTLVQRVVGTISNRVYWKFSAAWDAAGIQLSLGTLEALSANSLLVNSTLI